MRIWDKTACLGTARQRSGKESACQRRKHRRLGFNPQVGKIPWRRKWQPTPVFLPGKSHGQRSLVGYSPQDTCSCLCFVLLRRIKRMHLYPKRFLRYFCPGPGRALLTAFPLAHHTGSWAFAATSFTLTWFLLIPVIYWGCGNLCLREESRIYNLVNLPREG